MIGLLPAGIDEDQLNDLWGEGWPKEVETLLNFSLLSKKEIDNENKTKYTLPPFMSNYAEAKISDDEKIIF